MRLLNISTFTVEEFYNDIPEYAILSHTWGEGEVLLQHLQNGTERMMKGWPKIEGCCSLAAKDGWKYVWIDTCCIDKTSSAELSEAINSMFTWYKKSAICYAYLHDVQQHSLNSMSQFHNSRWFTRGWTLQELLAPSCVVFFDESWIEIGTKSSLQNEICNITRISTKHLTDFKSCSIATKMSWAAFRTTTRVEDTAYCLMGLFEVNMPLIYGEGRNSFIRLQLELIKSYDDESIFAWQGKTSRRALFAESPQPFARSANIEPFRLEDWKPFGIEDRKRNFAMTNKGLSFISSLYVSGKSKERGTPNLRFRRREYFLPLNCLTGSSASTTKAISIKVASVNGPHSEYFERVGMELFNNKLQVDCQLGPRREIFFKDIGDSEAGHDEDGRLQSILIFRYPQTFRNFSWRKYGIFQLTTDGLTLQESQDQKHQVLTPNEVELGRWEMVVAHLELRKDLLSVSCGISIVRHLGYLKIRIWAWENSPNLYKIYELTTGKGQSDMDSLRLKPERSEAICSLSGGCHLDGIIKVVLRPRGLEERFKGWTIGQFDVTVRYEL